VRNFVRTVGQAADFVRVLDLFDDEADPVLLTGYHGHLEISDGDGNLVVDSTTSPRVVVSTTGAITYRALPTDLSSPGAYRYALLYTDAAGVVTLAERGELYVDGVP
jgi:hypothetical protein